MHHTRRLRHEQYQKIERLPREMHFDPALQQLPPVCIHLERSEPCAHVRTLATYLVIGECENFADGPRRSRACCQIKLDVVFMLIEPHIEQEGLEVHTQVLMPLSGAVSPMWT